MMPAPPFIRYRNTSGRAETPLFPFISPVIRLLPVLFWLAALPAMCQVPAAFRHFTPITGPAPNAAALTKEAAWPAGLHNGSTDIDVPLGQVSGRQSGVPVFLRYRTTGIQAAEIATATGLGWSLHAGGAITRTVRGLPDESTNGYFATRSQLAGGSGDSAVLAGWQPGTALLKQLADKSKDSEPDLFYFNFMGREGRLVFDANGQAFTDPYSNYRIATSLTGNPNGATWNITADDGTIYLFGGNSASDFTTANLAAANSTALYPTAACTAWHLTAVISANHEDTLHFEYELEALQWQLRGPEANYEPLGNAAPKPAVVTTGFYEVYARRLRKIKSATGYCEFYPGPNRKDLAGSKSIDSVSFFSRAGTRLNHIILTYDYFKSIAGDTTTWRLQLKKVQEKTSVCNEKPPYSFVYNTQLLPAPLKAMPDYWGFYNCNPGHYRLEGRYRPANNKAMAGMLEQVKYPNGTNRKLHYELHTFSTIAGTAVKDTVYAYINHDLSAFLNLSGKHTNPNSNAHTGTDAFSFTCTYPQLVKLRLTHWDELEGFGLELWQLKLKLCLLNSAGDTILKYNDQNILPNWSMDANNNAILENVFLKPGQYTLTMRAENNLTTRREITATVFFQTRNQQAIRNYGTGGGLRLKRTEEEEGARTFTSNYIYRDGRLLYRPETKTFRYRERIAGVPNAYQAWITANETAPAGMYGGNIVYGSVTVTRSSKKDSNIAPADSTIYTFSTGPGDPGRETFPYPAQTAAVLKRGLPLSRQTHSATGVLRQEQYHSYASYADKVSMPGIRAGYTVWADAAQQDTLAWQPYRLTAGWGHPAAINTVTYETANSRITDTREYTYDAGLLLPRREARQQSDGSTRITEYRYTGDWSCYL